MDEDKFKEKLIYARKKLCPFCRNIFVYFCIKCVSLFISCDHVVLHRDNIYGTMVYMKRHDNTVYENFQGMLCMLMLLYFYQTVSTNVKRLEEYLNEYDEYKCEKQLEKSCVDDHKSTLSNIFLIKANSFVPTILSQEKQIKENYVPHKGRSIVSITSAQPDMGQNVVASSSSIKSKKSSNLLAAFVRRARKKKNKNSETLLKTVTISTHNLNFIGSNSSLGAHTEEEMELNIENYENKVEVRNMDYKFSSMKKEGENIVATDSEHSINSTVKVKSQFFRKLVKKQVSLEHEKKKSEHALAAQTSNGNVAESKTSCKICQSDSFNEVIPARKVCGVPTSFINFGSPTLNIALANGLQSVQELSSRFRESEKHLMQILVRYIKDQSFQKELIDTLSQHSKLQWDAERRTGALANDMWMHQIEIGRAQERTLQETLNSLVKQNRQLQIDNEIMFRKHERLVRKLRSFPEMSLKYKCMDCTSQIEHIMKHNEKMQEKLDAHIQQLENLENELHILQKQNDGMEQQLRHYSLQVHNLKATIQRSKTDYELEIVTLNYKLETREQTIKESIEAGDILLEDLDGLKRQFKNLPFAINWSKFKCRGSCLTDLIHISRSSINELAKELVSLYTQITLKDKDIETLQETNSKLQENLQKSTTELNNMSKKLDETSFHETDKIMMDQKCKLLETDIRVVNEKIEKLQLKCDTEKSSLLNQMAKCDHLKEEMEEKDKLIEQTKLFVTNITSENITLRTQVESLNRIMSESGAGDVVKELAKCQEQLAYFQSQYYQLLNDKQYYKEKVEKVKSENKSTIEHQELNYKQLHAQVQELEKKNNENSSLRQQIESEHQTVLSLQNERMKYLEEKNMLKTIFQHMKTEIARVQKLETTVSDITKEASKLAMIAEYNKQLGDKLKSEVQEKEEIILQLRTSVEKLNDIQIQNTKEKLSLCYELSEVCQMKDQLNTILSMEVQKNAALDDSKKEIVETTSCQLKKYEEMQKNERSALKDLARECKILVKQRDCTSQENEKLHQEIAVLKDKCKDQLKKMDDLVFVKNEKDLNIADLTAKQEKDKALINNLQEQISNELAKYAGNLDQLDKLIRQLRREKEELETSIKYLQNNMHKLHNDLNDSRKNEKEAKDQLNKCIQEKEALSTEKEQRQRDIMVINEEKDKLISEVNYLNALCERVLTDFETSIKSSLEKEDIYKKEIKESKAMLLINSNEIKRLSEAFSQKQNELHQLIEENKTLKLKDKQFNDMVNSYENQKNEFKQIKSMNHNLEDEIYKMKVEQDSSKIYLENFRKEAECLQKQLKIVIDEKENDYAVYRSHMDEISRKHDELQGKYEKELNELKISQNDLSQKLYNERSAYETLSEIHKDISAKYLKSVKNAVEEKNSRQEIEANFKEINSSLEVLNSEKADLQQQITILLNGINESKNRLNTLIQEKNTHQLSMEDLQKRYNESLTKNLSLESQLRVAELKFLNDTYNDNLKEQIEQFKRDSQENHEQILCLKDNITKLEQQVTTLEFQKSEMTLRLHENQRKLETEQSLCEQLKNTHKLILASILKLKDEGKVDPCDFNYLFHMVHLDDGDSICNNEESLIEM